MEKEKSKIYVEKSNSETYHGSTHWAIIPCFVGTMKIISLIHIPKLQVEKQKKRKTQTQKTYFRIIKEGQNYAHLLVFQV